MKNCARKWCKKLCPFYLEVTFDIEEMCYDVPHHKQHQLSYMCGLLEMISIRRMTRRAKYLVEFMFYSSQVLWKTVRT